MTHTITLELRRGRRKAAKGSTHLSCTGSMRRSLILGRDRHLTFRIQRAGDGGTTGLVRTHWDPAELLRQITSSIDRNTSHRRSLWFSTSSSSARALLLYFCSETDVGGSYKTFKSNLFFFFFFFAKDEHRIAAQEKHSGVLINKIWNKMNIKEHFCCLEDTWRLPAKRLTDFILLRLNCWAWIFSFIPRILIINVS